MKNFKKKKWLNENGLETCFTMQPSEQIYRQNGENFPSGFPAMTLKEIFNAGYEQCLKDFEDFKQSRTAEENGG